MFIYNEEQLIIKESIKDLFKDIGLKNKNIEDFKKFNESAVNVLIENGYYAMNIPKEYGGLGLDFTTCIIVLSEISKGNASLADLLSTTCFGFVDLIIEFGSKEQIYKYVRSIAEEGKTAAFIYNEEDASDWSRIKTIAKKDGENYILNGAKTMITNVLNADYGLIFTKVIDENNEVGYAYFIVELKDNPGITFGTVERTMGMEGLEIASIYFDNCIVHKKNMLGNKGNEWKVLIKMLEKNRVCNCAFSYGIASAAYEEALEHCKTHTIEGALEIDNAYVGKKIGEMYAMLEVMENILFNTSNLIDEHIDNVINYVTSVKYFITETSKKICDISLQLHGGYGYIKDYYIEQLYRDARLNTIIGGPTEAILSRIGKGIAKNKIYRN